MTGILRRKNHLIDPEHIAGFIVSEAGTEVVLHDSTEITDKFLHNVRCSTTATGIIIIRNGVAVIGVGRTYGKADVNIEFPGGKKIPSGTKLTVKYLASIREVDVNTLLTRTPN